jgi:large subunit ribosomal protein L21
MFAVIKTGGKQYRVAADDVITIARLEGEPGSAVTFGSVLMLSGESGTEIGGSDVTVSAEVLRHGRGDKVIAFKKRRRQDFTVVRITDLMRAGQALPRAAQPAPAAAPTAAPASEAASA